MQRRAREHRDAPAAATTAPPVARWKRILAAALRTHDAAHREYSPRGECRPLVPQLRSSSVVETFRPVPARTIGGFAQDLVETDQLDRDLQATD
jgi:hypothetical protein